MKKILFVLIAFFIYSPILAQKNKNVETIKENAEKWFKEVYVEQYFKDPYSYRLMGLKAIPVSYKELLMKDLANIQNDIDTCTVSKNERNQSAHDDCLKEYEECKIGATKEQEYIDKGVEVEYHTKRKAIFVQYGNRYLELAKRIKLYLLAVEEKERITSLINNLTDEEANKLACYDIRLDCYSKNSLGNEVLGRFSFLFTENGLLGGEKGIDNVIQLNK